MGLAETLGFNLIPWTVQITALIICVASGAGFVMHSRRVDKPVLDLSLLKLKTFRASVTGGTLVRMGIGATPFLMPLLVQIAMGWSALQAGFLMVGIAVGALASRPLAARMMRMFGFRTILVWTAILVGILSAAPGLFRDGTSPILMFIALAAGGFARATQFTASNALSFVEVDQKTVTSASTLSAVMLQLSISTGITVGSLALQLVRIGAGPVLKPEQFTLPFCVVGVLSAAAALIYARLPRDVGSDMTGHRRARA